ncbi:molybdate ABC transporter substrate-binding protein [Nostocaceae cyanobacterium CENA357]|uniref:Molybdate ABC transporter substrate-binding protein n=1 Tax=Atlanticothrix silvestris CENA357 TaxID=1725252 RepID=A0A8J7HG45_9CYAN|nr:molybdate ABC transporter substrate-binding protein [Atlanticothrix silvestris]MBH8551688.1 molybdate ABC transporter substrate-binding protein [Atlanticothrix silvestris CENA357]
MKRKRFLSLTAWILVSFLAVVGCNQVASNTPDATSSPQAQATELTISAAASMQDAMKAMEPIYREKHPNTKIIYNFGSSGSLQQQIEQGAPVDVFISAAEKQMKALAEKNLLLPGTRKDLLGNEVVLITSQKTTGISNFQDLTSNQVQRFSIGDPESVPAGQYAQEVLTALKLYDAIKPKIVFAKDVRQVLSYVETGNVNAGIVYATDAKSSDQVKVVATAPKDSHKPIIYPIAVIQRSQNQEAAKEFVQFLSSDAAKPVFKKYGFTPLNP